MPGSAYDAKGSVESCLPLVSYFLSINQLSLMKDSCKFRSRRDHAHFILYDLQEYDINYLWALLEDNKTIIAQHEIAAMQKGYGPLVPCTYVASSSQHTQHCREYDSNLAML